MQASALTLDRVCVCDQNPMPLSLSDLPTALLQHIAPFLSLADAVSRIRCCARRFATPTTMPIRTLLRGRLLSLRHHCLLPQTLYPTCVVPPRLRSEIRSLLYDAYGPNPSLFCDLRDVAGITVAKPMALASLYSGLEELHLHNVNATTHEIDFDTVFTTQRSDSSATLPPGWQLRTLLLIGPHAHVTDNDSREWRAPYEQRLLHSTILQRLLPLHSATLRVLEIRLCGSPHLPASHRIAQQETDELLLSGLVRAISSSQLHGLERLRLEYQQECAFDEEEQRKRCGAQTNDAVVASDDGGDPLAFYNFSRFSPAKSTLMRRLWHSLPSLIFLQLAWFHPLLVLPFHAAMPQLQTLHFAGLLTYDSLPSLARFSSLQHLLLDFHVEEEELRREWKGEPRLDEQLAGIRTTEEDAALAAAASFAVPATHAAPQPLEEPDEHSSKDVDVSFYVFHALARLRELRSIQLQSTLQERNCCRVDWDNFTLLQPLAQLTRLQFSCFVPPSVNAEPSSTVLAPPVSSGLSLTQLKLAPNLVDAVTPLVYLGSKQANTPALRSLLGFTHVVQISGLPHTHLAGLPEPPVHAEGRHLYVQLDDDEGAMLADHLPAFFDFMATCDEKKGHRVLVHCDAGVSRSASFVIAYLMRTHGMSLRSALDHVQQSRPVIEPNLGFRSQLAALELTWRRPVASAVPPPSVDLSWELDRLCETLPQLQDVIVNIERREEYENDEGEDEEDDGEDEAEEKETATKQANALKPSTAPLVRLSSRVLAPYVLSSCRPRRLKKLGVWDGHASATSDGAQCILTNLAPFLTSFPKLHSLSLIFCHVATLLPLSTLADSLVSLCLYFTQTPQTDAADPTIQTADRNIAALSSLRNLHWLILHGTGDPQTCLSVGQLLQLGSVVSSLPRLRNCRVEHQPAMSATVWHGWMERGLCFPHLCSLSFKDCSGLGVEGVLAVLHAVMRSLADDAASSASPALLPLLVDLNVVHAWSALDASNAESASIASACSLVRAAESRALRHVQLHIR